MNQPTLFDLEPNVIPYPPVELPWTGSETGNGWHRVCQGRMQSYGFKLLESRHSVAGQMEIDGYYRTAAGVLVAVEYKERLSLRIWRECVGQAYLATTMLRKGSENMIVIVLTGAIAQELADKPALVNAASDLITLVANPQVIEAEKVLRVVAKADKNRVAAALHKNLFDRIARQGGFLGLQQPVFLN